MTDTVSDEEFSELVDATIPRLDLVGKGANGMPFLIAKSADDAVGIVPAELVRDLISKSDESLEEATVTDTPAEADVTKAPDDVDLDASTVLPDGANPEETGAQTVPGSPAWEQLDADTARKWTAILSRAKNALGVLAERESVESISGDLEDGMNAGALSDAACAIDYAIGVLAGFAAGEEAEAQLAEADLEAVGKAAAGIDPASLDVLEGLAPVVKAGRVLSSSNEAAIRGAVDSLQKVLASLPAAPTTDDVAKADADPKEGKTVNQTPDAPAATDDAEPGEDLPVEKADDLSGTSDADLKRMVLTGSSGDRNKALQELGLRTLTGGSVAGGGDSAPSEDDTAPADEVGGDAAGDDVAAAAADGGDATAAPADDSAAAGGDDAATIPGTNTVQAPPAAGGDDDVTKSGDDLLEVLKGSMRGEMAAVLGEVLSPLLEEVAKARDLGSVVEGLKERVEHIAKQPDNRRSPLLNGGTGAPGLAGRDGLEGDQFADLRKAVDDAKSETERTQAKSALAFAEVRARFQQ